MRRFALLLAVIFMCLTEASAFAATRCVSNGFGQFFKFYNVVLQKGKSTQLVGQWVTAGGALPLDGVVSLDTDGVTTRVGIITYPGLSLSAVMWSMVGNKVLTGTGNFYNPPFSDAGADTWTSVNCNTIPTTVADDTQTGIRPGVSQ